VDHFLASLQAELQEIREVLRNPADMIMTGTDQKVFGEAADCHISDEALVNDRVRDHCHINIVVQFTMDATYEAMMVT